jgi:hypothetical protein
MATKNHIPESAAAAESLTRASAPDAFSLENIWLNAFARLPDAKPLADLLRDYSTPMPPGIRDQLAEMLNPGDPDIVGGRLVFTPTDGIGRAVEEWLPLVIGYRAEADRRKRAGRGDASQNAAKFVGKQSKTSDRTVYRKLQAWRALVARLRGSS